MHFVYVKVPLSDSAGRALDALHDQLEQALDDAGIGELVGWGTSRPSSRSAERDGGSFHRLDLRLTHLEPGLAVLQDILVELGVAQGTELHLTRDGTALQRSLSPEEWTAEVASTASQLPKTNRREG